MLIDNNKIPNARKAELIKNHYKQWKNYALDKEGWFPIFTSFKEEFLLRDLSGNAVRLYLYLGLHSKNETGECWVSIDNIAKYFNKAPRTVSGWIKELEDAQIIKRMQLEKDSVAYTFLRPY